MSAVLLALSLSISFLFFLYGYNCFYFCRAMRRYRMPASEPIEGGLPRIAVHLPIYNERYVVRRLVEACTLMARNYDPEATRIVVIDDSDDDTAAEIDEVVAEAVLLGYRVETMRRPRREGFKAGALQFALERTPEEYIAVFDADFIPREDFLSAALPYLEGESDVGIVQSRWEHLNADYSPLTRAIALGIDVHFYIEQPARFAAGCYMNFNGSGGIMRRAALEAVGGWQADTLAEDLDMSYRLQMNGFRILYLRDLTSPAEVPSTMPSYRRQQARWANGSLRAAKKLLPALLTKEGIGVKRRFEGFLHLTYYIVQALMFLSFLLTFVSVLLGADTPHAARKLADGLSPGLPLPVRVLEASYVLAILLCTAVSLLYPLAVLRERGKKVSGNAGSIGLLMLLGFGLSYSNTVEAAKALFTRRIWAFSRTPKYAIREGPDKWKDKRYQIPYDGKMVVEACLAFAGGAAAVAAVRLGSYVSALILLFYSVSFAFVVSLSLVQGRPREGMPR